MKMLSTILTVFLSIATITASARDLSAEERRRLFMNLQNAFLRQQIVCDPFTARVATLNQNFGSISYVPNVSAMFSSSSLTAVSIAENGQQPLIVLSLAVTIDIGVDAVQRLEITTSADRRSITAVRASLRQRGPVSEDLLDLSGPMGLIERGSIQCRL